MTEPDDEDERLRAVALRNARSIQSARRRAEEGLRKQSEWLRVTLASIGDAVISTDAEGRVTYMNAVAEALTGWPQAAALTLPLPEVFLILNEHGRQPLEDPAQRVLREGTVVGLANHTILIARDGTERAIDDTAAPIRDERGHVAGVVLVFRDVSERRRLEDELEHVAADLSEAHIRKDEFLAMLAHELRNPLAPLRNGLQVLRRATGDAALIEQTRSMMERQLGQLVRLVDDLLDASRISRGNIDLRREHLDLDAVVGHAVEAARPAYEAAGVRLAVTAPAERTPVHGDQTRLVQVVGNLLSNACKFTERGGEVHLRIERDGAQAVIRVRDTGIGIAPEQCRRIFDLFTQVDTSLERSQSGLGIGLTLAQKIVTLHAGTLDVHSPGLGAGSEFVVRLPLTRGEEALAPTVRAKPVHTCQRILVVDDNSDSADSLAMLLEMAGHETRTAYDGRAALDAASAFHPGVVLLDIGLPEVNGYEAARHIRAQPWGNDVLLVALTGWGQEEDQRRAIDAGFDHHLVKPIDFATLTDLLNSRARP